jgi:hypothetical protein
MELNRTFKTEAERAAYQAAIDDMRKNMESLAHEIAGPTPPNFYNMLYWQAYSEWLSNNHLRPVWSSVLRLVCLAKNRNPLTLAANGSQLLGGDVMPAVDTLAGAEDAAIAEGMAFDAGVASARKGIHELFLSEDGAEIPGLTGEIPFCRFKFFEDKGDASVGIPGHAYWALADDQSGTELAGLLERAAVAST